MDKEIDLEALRTELLLLDTYIQEGIEVFEMAKNKLDSILVDLEDDE